MKTKRHPLLSGRTGYPGRVSPWPTPPSRASHVDSAPARRLEPGSDPLSGRRQAQAALGRARSRALTPTPAGGFHAVAGGAGNAVCDVGGWKRLTDRRQELLRPRLRTGTRPAGHPVATAYPQGRTAATRRIPVHYPPGVTRPVCRSVFKSSALAGQRHGCSTSPPKWRRRASYPRSRGPPAIDVCGERCPRPRSVRYRSLAPATGRGLIR